MYIQHASLYYYYYCTVAHTHTACKPARDVCVEKKIKINKNVHFERDELDSLAGPGALVFITCLRVPADEYEITRIRSGTRWATRVAHPHTTPVHTDSPTNAQTHTHDRGRTRGLTHTLARRRLPHAACHRSRAVTPFAVGST